MDIETLLGLQQAYADLAMALNNARTLAPLQDWIDRDLAPRVHDLGQRLRRAERCKTSEVNLSSLVRELKGLQEQIRKRAEDIRCTSLYRSALMAFHAENFQELERLLPGLFSDVKPTARPHFLVVPFDLAQRHRKPGQPPFASPGQVADRIARVAKDGLIPEPEPEPPWGTDFPFLLAAGDPEDLAAPVWLIVNGPSLAAAVLADKAEPGFFRIYTPRLRAFTAVGIATKTEDEWWLSQEPSFEEYRLLLAQELRARGVAVEGVP